MEQHGMDFSLVEMYFHISPEGMEEAVFQLPAAEFRNKEAMQIALAAGGQMVQATGNELAASFIGTSLCNACSVMLLMAAQYNRLLDLSMNNLTLQVELHDDHAHLGYKIESLRWQDLPQEEPAWSGFLLARMTDYITNEVVPAVEAIAEHAGVKNAMIWSQYAYQLAFVRDFVQENEPRQEVLARFLRGYELVTEGIPAEAFNRKRNPFLMTSPRFVDNPWEPEKPIMLRSSCCMYNCRVGGEKCYNCPKMTHDEREIRKAQVLAELEKSTATA